MASFAIATLSDFAWTGVMESHLDEWMIAPMSGSVVPLRDVEVVSLANLATSVPLIHLSCSMLTLYLCSEICLIVDVEG